MICEHFWFQKIVNDHLICQFKVQSKNIIGHLFSICQEMLSL